MYHNFTPVSVVSLQINQSATQIDKFVNIKLNACLLYTTLQEQIVYNMLEHWQTCNINYHLSS